LHNATLRTGTWTLLGEVIRLAWPAVVQGLLTTVVFFSDRLILGRYGGQALASMQISGPVIWSVFTVFGAFGAGALAVIGRLFGARETDKAGETLAVTIAFGAFVGVVVGVAGYASSGWIAAGVGGDGASADILTLSESYMRVLFVVAPLHFAGTVAFTGLYAVGDTRSPMIISGISGCINIAVSVILVFGLFGFPSWGVVGAAVGSAISLSLNAFLAHWLLVRGRSPLRIRASLQLRWELMRPVFRISVPAFGEKLIYHTGFVFFAAFVGRLGDVAMEANVSLIAIESWGFILASGVGVASGALVAQKLGAGRVDEASRCGWLSAAVAVLMLLVVSTVFVFLPEELIGLFTDDPLVTSVAIPCLKMAAIAQPLMALSDAMGGALRGAGDTRSPMVVALVGPVIIRLVLCWILAFELEMGLFGIWVATTVDWAARALLLSVVFALGKWKTISFS
jgi:multidrug resistance protein, MATE family